MTLAKYYATCAIPKSEPRKKTKARADRAEAKVAAACRAWCVDRDGLCRFSLSVVGDTSVRAFDLHEGPSEWCHLPMRRRSATRNMDPTYRHDPKFTLMLCRKHHDQLDGRIRPRLIITALTRKGCEGPLKFRRQG